MADIGYLQVTRQCNQQCLFCSNPENDNRLEWSAAVDSIRELAEQGYSGVILTGGEPTLYADLPRLIARCATSGLEPRIISNGQRLTDRSLVEELVSAGLNHVHLSLHSSNPETQDYLAQTAGSFDNLRTALGLLGELGISVDVNTVINSFNSDHLDVTVEWIVQSFPFVRHFVWNNLDPHMNRVKHNPEVIPSLQGFEVSLFRALSFLERNERTFRVERVPLCYMAEFAACSTETRKIAKSEKRVVHFLDERRRFEQVDFFYEKGTACEVCTLTALCAGVYCGNDYYSLDEIYPLFLDPAELLAAIRGPAPSCEAP
jgi:MoaA/NifB/PqqE/SkfB family radical SAM enzyme